MEAGHQGEQVVADDIDRANDKAQDDLDKCIAVARMSGTYLEPVGLCHNCAEPIERGEFCDSHCRDDWQRRNPGK
jgi:hypothetical protein